MWKSVEPALVEDRHAPRRRIELTRAELGARGEPPVPVELCEVSTFGCRLSGQADVAAGEPIWIRLVGAAKVAAVVVWNRDAMLGCRFDTPIDRTTMRTLVLGDE